MNRTPVDVLTARELGLPLPLQRERLEQQQLYSLQRLVSRLRELSPFYRSHLRDIHANELNAINDLAKLPFLTPEQVVEADKSILELPQTAVERIISLQTSGSTGQPKRIHYAKSDLDATRRFFYYGMLSLIGPEDRVMTLLPFEQENSTGQLLIQALTSRSIFCTGCWPFEPEKITAAILEKNITCIVGLPQHLLELASRLAQAPTFESSLPVRTMLLCSDYSPQPLRYRITDLCGAETYLHWGSTETGLGGAVECDCHQGCHLRESQLVVEIIDPRTGDRLPDGEIGEIVVTTLAREGTVLLRYRTGDIGAVTSRQCLCGGTTARLIKLHGRNISCRIAGNDVSSRELDDRLFSIDELLDFRAELSDAGNYKEGLLTVFFRTIVPAEDTERKILHQLKQIKAIGSAVENHELVMAAHRMEDLCIPNHTFKRSLCDNRNRKKGKNQCGLYSIN